MDSPQLRKKSAQLRPFRMGTYLCPMTKSMTGFGSAQLEDQNLSVRVEVKSLNSKTLDLSVRLPRQLQDKEFEIRNMVSRVLDRGKVLLNAELEYLSKASAASQLNAELLHYHFAAVLDETRKLPVEIDHSHILQSVLRMPEVMAPSNGRENREQEWLLVQAACEKAIQACDDFRVLEGRNLSLKVEEYLSNIRSLLNQVVLLDPERSENVRMRLEEKLGALRADSAFDQNRFEQEMIYYLEKMDISEEKTRLAAHLDHFLEVMKNEENAGRKLGFIAQEIGREINTIGSKANHAGIQKLVVLMKDDLEKIKEQGLNFL